MDAAPPLDPAVTSRELAAIAAAYWEYQLEESPSLCTNLGLSRGLDRLDEKGPAARARQQGALDALRRRVEALPPDSLVGEERLTRAILLRLLSESVEAFRHRGWEWDLDPLMGVHLEIQDLVGKHPLATPSDVDALLSRYAAVPRALEQLVGDLRDGLSSGRVSPTVAYDRVVAQLRAFLAQPTTSTAFAGPGDRLPATWPSGDRDKAKRRILDAAEATVRPAYAAFLGFLETEYAGRSRKQVGVASIPGGADAYAFAARRHTTTTLSPDRIHKIGVEELERNEAEMLAIAKAEGHTGDLRSFLERVAKDPRFRLGTREEVLERYRTICKKMDARLPEIFGHLPRRGYEIRALEPWREKDAPAAYYHPPGVHGGRPGIFYANTHDPSSWPTYDMETLSFHEAVPGHHFQIALAVELDGLPEFRRHASFTAYIEGWAHYAERLADEMGAYSTPYDRLGMLAGQAWRAARLVVDTGMHALGWDRKKAVEVMRRIRSGPERDVDNEVDRYITWPGQALAYKIGQRTFADLRSKAQSRLGAQFKLAAFHDEVLRHGALPLSLLEDVVRSWSGA